LLALGIKPVPDATVTVNSSNGSSEHTTIAIDRLQCGPLSVENLQLPLLDRYALPDADGLLGIAGLGPYRVDIDLKRLAARVVESRDDRVGREWHALKIRAHASGLALVDVRIAGVKCVAVVDTGAERSVGNHALRAALGSTDTPRASTNATTVLNDANGTAQVAVLQLVEELTLGRALLPRGAMAFASAPVFRSLDLDSRPALLLGLDRLRAFSSMALDYRHSRLLLEKLKP
jgi:predicted aspartyl protease